MSLFCHASHPSLLFFKFQRAFRWCVGRVRHSALLRCRWIVLPMGRADAANEEQRPSSLLIRTTESFRSVCISTMWIHRKRTLVCMYIRLLLDAYCLIERQTEWRPILRDYIESGKGRENKRDKCMRMHFFLSLSFSLFSSFRSRATRKRLWSVGFRETMEHITQRSAAAAVSSRHKNVVSNFRFKPDAV